MKTPTTYTPYYLSLSLAIVFVAMFALTNSQTEKTYAIATSENGSRVNKPGPSAKKRTEQKIIEGTPVFLKEDVREEVVSRSDKRNVSISNSISETQWMNQHTTMESKSGDDKTPYLVLAGSYTENMLLLSKHAQYKNKGYDAEIISFDANDARHICLGRFTKKEQASAHSKKVGEELDIRTYVFEKGK